MIYELYAIYDRISGMYAAPVPQVNKMCAVRWFNDIVTKDPHGEDFELYYVGSYDSKLGELVGSKPAFICRYGDEVKDDG